MSVLKKIIALSAALLIQHSLFSFDLTTGFNLGNLGFSRETDSNEPGLIWGFYTAADYQVNETLSFYGEILKDDVSGNRINSQLTYKGTYAEISFGPSIASINNSQIIPKPAMNGAFTIKKEGLFSFSASMYTTLGSRPDRSDDYTQSRVSLALGMNIPGALTSFSYSNDLYNRSDVSDSQSIFKLDADLYKKNVPFHLLLSLGYKRLVRTYPEDDPEERETAGMGSLFIGAGTMVKLGKRMELIALLDNGLYNFTLSETLSLDDIPAYLFEVRTSIRYKF